PAKPTNTSNSPSHSGRLIALYRHLARDAANQRPGVSALRAAFLCELPVRCLALLLVFPQESPSIRVDLCRYIHRRTTAMRDQSPAHDFDPAIETKLLGWLVIALAILVMMAAAAIQNN